MDKLYFSVPAATVLTLLAAAMWGSWMQVVKHRKDYPITGIIFLLYTFSLVLVWGVTFILTPVLLPEGIIHATSATPSVVAEILLGGAMMSMGLYISLQVMGKVGLLLFTAISGAVGSILGIFTSLVKEGFPDSPYALLLVLGCTVIFIAAAFTCNYAAVLRDRDRAGGAAQTGGKGPITAKIVLLTLLSAFLTNGWSIGTASGTASGFPPVLTCAYMATGSFLSVFLVCSLDFTRKRQWKQVLCIGYSKRPLLLGAVSAFCHYGGNLISIYAMPALSATLSFLFGRTSNVWTYLWGLFYREFSGSKRRTLAILFLGILLYIAGTLLLAVFNYNG